MCGVTSSSTLFPGPFPPGVVVPVRVPSLSQKGLFENDLYSIGPFDKK